MNSPSAPAPSQVPLKTKLSWAAGSFFENVMANAILTMVMPIFNLGFGVNAIWLGWAQSLPRAFDAFFDPLLGHLSDNTRTRWGRRRPWIAASAIFSTLLYMLLWFASPSWPKEVLIAWYAGITAFFFLIFGMYQISFSALGMELSSDYDERTRIMAWRYLFIMASFPLVGWIYKMCFIPFFQIGMPQGSAHPEIFGMRGVGLLVGLVSVLTVLPLIFACKEKPTGGPTEQRGIKLADAFRETFTNRVFLLFLGLVLFSVLGTFVWPMHTYIAIYFVEGGNKEAGATLMGYYTMANFASSLVTVPVVNYFSSRFGKKAVLMGGQLLGIFSALSTWFLFTPTAPWLFIVYAFFGNMALGSLMILYNSVIADICDMDELKTGSRREGMYGAVGNFMFKLVFSASTIIVGYMLAMSGFQESKATQSPETLQILRAIVALFPAIMTAIACALIGIFPLTRRKAAEIRAQLEARRKESHGVHA